jgi:hypothetical protein
MAYKLIFSECPVEGQITKDIGENVFLADLPNDYKVYVFYYGGAMANEPLEERLRVLGNITGNNLFVNIGRLNDPQYDEVKKRFGIKQFPVIIMTAIDTLASPVDDYITSFVRLDSKYLLDSPDRTVECVQELFNLFILGKVSKAMSLAKQQQRAELLRELANVFATGFESLKDFIAERDIYISLLEGKFELKRSGD